MKTKLLTAPDETAVESIQLAAECLQHGGLVAVPTETVYGLAASAFCEEAVQNIFKAKGRPSDNPLIVHIADQDELDGIAKEIPPLAKQCMDAFWPGPFTAVLPKSDAVPSIVSGGLDTVAVRMPSHPVTRAIIKAAALPLAAPSANRSGSPSPSTAAHVIEDLKGRIDAIVVSDDCAVGVESTVVTFVTDPPRLLRPGGVTVEQLKVFIPDLVIDPAVTHQLEQGMNVASPGMKYKHYAPKAEVVLAIGSQNAFVRFCHRQKQIYDFALCYEEELSRLPIPAMSLGKEKDYGRQAELLFSHLRELDKRNVSRVIVHAPDKVGLGLAVYNRLIRAAAFRVLQLPTIIGLTGPSGSGKTTFCETAKQLGFFVIDCDKKAAEVRKDPALLDQLEKTFGGVVREGRLDRQALADKAFADRASTERLNALLLPPIAAAIEQEIDTLCATGICKILLDAPTLFESGLDRICDTVIALLADEPLRAKRLKKRDDLTEEQLQKRLNAQQSEAFYRKKSAHIMYNNGKASDLQSAAEIVLRSKILKETDF